MAVKILSVDDELDLEVLLTQYFRRQIRKGEYEFAFAHNGLEALQKLLETPDFDIILSDINMPEMDGLTLLAKVNELKNPAMKQANINTGTLRVYMLIRLQIISVVQQVSKATLDVKRNFSRNMMAKVRAIPAMEA